MYRKQDEVNTAVTLLIGRRRRAVQVAGPVAGQGQGEQGKIRPFEECSEEVVSCLFDRSSFVQEIDAFNWWKSNKERVLNFSV